jgi:uncharacterized protein YcbX
MPVTVSQLAVAPVKGMRLHGTREIRLGQHGVTGDREFLVIGEDGVWCDIIRPGRIHIGDLVRGPEPRTDFP